MTGDSARIFSARRQIKRDAVDVAAHRPIVAVIPCRRCYDFQLNLWSAPFGRGTLLDRAIKTCLASPLFDRIAVASDTDEVQAVLSEYAEPRLCYVPRTTASTLASQPIADTLAQVKAALQLEGDGVFVLTYLQAPFTTTETVEEAVSTLAVNEAHSSIAVDEVKLPLHRRSAFGLVSLNNSGRVSSDFDRVYAEVRTCMATRFRNLRSGTSTGSRIVHFEIPEGETFFIRSARDLEIARLIAQTQSPET
jgi:CMP-N-acetylneuraminic acid synthetase